MPTFSPSYPKHKPFQCCAAWHLRTSGLYLAVYDLIGAVTAGGDNPFYSSIAHVARFFDANYETVRRVFKGLRKLGWLILEPNGEYRYVTHAQWATTHNGHCNKRELLPWQIETDPLVGQLHAASGGRLRVMEQHLAHIRKFGTDDEILDLFRKEMAAAKCRKEAGHYEGTSPKSCLWNVAKLLRQRGRRPVIDPKSEQLHVEL